MVKINVYFTPISLLFSTSSTSQQRSMQTVYQTESCWLCHWWWKRRTVRPAGLEVPCPLPHWTSMTMRTFPPSLATPQKHMTRVRGRVPVLAKYIINNFYVLLNTWSCPWYNMFFLCVSLVCRWGAGLPWGSEWQTAHQRGLQVQRG